jgi:membrane-associated phospholipid phosphatase
MVLIFLSGVGVKTGAFMVQTKRFPLLPALSLLAAGAMCLPASAQSIAVQGVSPATSIAQSEQTDIHLSSTSRATTTLASGFGFSSPATAKNAFLTPLSSATSIAQSALAGGPLSSTSRATTTTTTKGPALARFASGTGNILFLGVGTLLPLIEDGKNGQNHALRTADSLLTSTLITEALKAIVREKRPDGGARNSFPSGHATAAFAVATMQAHYHPNQALLWYAGATAISYSRVKLRRHYTQDVLAGAAIGFLTARFEIKQPRGLLLSPFIRNRREGGGSGLSVSMNF